MESLSVKLENTNGVSTLLVGDALTPLRSKKISITTTINGPADFVVSRFKNLPENYTVEQAISNASYATVITGSNKIELYTNPNDEAGTVITGVLEVSDELKQLQINTAKKFDRKELLQMLKFNRNLFADPQEYNTLITALNKLTAETSGQMQKGSDDRGNKSSLAAQQVTTNLPETFAIRCKLHKGIEETGVFQVSVCYDYADTGGYIWLQSVELNDFQKFSAENILNEQAGRIKDAGVLVLFS